MATEQTPVESDANATLEITYTVREDNQLNEVTDAGQLAPETQKRIWTLDRKLLAVKIHYFLFFGSVAGFIPFAMRYLMQIGANSTQVGILYSILPFASLLAKPIGGAFADKFRQHKAVFLSSIALMVSAFFSIYFIPIPSFSSTGNPANTSIVCNETGVFLTLCLDTAVTHHDGSNATDQHPNFDIFTCDFACRTNFSEIFSSCSDNDTNVFCANRTFTAPANFSAVFLLEGTDHCGPFHAAMLEEDHVVEQRPTMTCPSQYALDCDTSCNVSNVSVFANGTAASNHEPVHVPSALYWFGAFMVLAYIGLGTGTSMGDTVVLDILGDRAALFGRQRLWGAVGWGIFSIVTGQLIDVASRGSSVLVFTPGFFVVLILGVADVGVASRVPVSRARKTPTHLGRDSLLLFASFGVVMYSMAVLMIGVFTGILWVYVIVYLNDLGASQLLIGLTLGVQGFLGELPFFFIANWFIEKIGHVHSMTLVLAVFGTRFFFYSLIINPWTVLPIEILHGITFGVFFTALATYPSVVASQEMAATVQGIFQGLFEGFGVGIGYLLGGYLYGFYKGKRMFLVLSRVAIVTCLLYGGIQVALQLRNTRRRSLKKNDIQTSDKYLSNVEMQPMNSQGKVDEDGNLMNGVGTSMVVDQ